MTSCSGINDTNGICSNLEGAGVGVGAFFTGLLNGGFVGFIITIMIIGAVALLITGIALGMRSLLTNLMSRTHYK